MRGEDARLSSVFELGMCERLSVSLGCDSGYIYQSFPLLYFSLPFPVLYLPQFLPPSPSSHLLPPLLLLTPLQLCPLGSFPLSTCGRKSLGTRLPTPNSPFLSLPYSLFPSLSQPPPSLTMTILAYIHMCMYLHRKLYWNIRAHKNGQLQ